jgi:hypothetical protein
VRKAATIVANSADGRGVGTDVKDVKIDEKKGVSCGKTGANEVLVSN